MASYSGFRNLSLNLKHLSDLVLRLNFLEKYLHLKVPVDTVVFKIDAGLQFYIQI